MALESTTTLPPFCSVVTKFGNLNFLEPSGPLQACNGTDLPLPLSVDQPKMHAGGEDCAHHGVVINSICVNGVDERLVGYY